MGRLGGKEGASESEAWKSWENFGWKTSVFATLTHILNVVAQIEIVERKWGMFKGWILEFG